MDHSILSTTTTADELLLETPDLSSLDPSTQGGFKVIFAREVPLEIRFQTSDVAPADAGTLEAILCKVCVREGEGGRPLQVKVELSSEGDLFFHYTHLVDERAYSVMRDEQKLMIDFTAYPSVLVASLTDSIKSPHVHLAVLIMDRSGVCVVFCIFFTMDSYSGNCQFFFSLYLYIFLMCLLFLFLPPFFL